MAFMTQKNDYSDDDLLMQRIAAGDQNAFSLLFDREAHAIYKLAYINLKDEALAEDITQETFTRLWTHAGKWQPDAMIRTWLLRVTRNLCIDVLRKQQRESNKNNNYSVEIEVRQNNKNIPSTFDLHHAHVTDKIQSTIFLLPERQREALSLVYYSGCTGAEAAEVLGLTLSALESLLARARRNLRERLSEHRNELMESYHDR